MTVVKVVASIFIVLTIILVGDAADLDWSGRIAMAVVAFFALAGVWA